MRDNRFIELINLYIDRQISAEETAELEAEMQDNPRRRATYRQYCQLHSATKQVYDRFRTSAADPQPAAPAGRTGIAKFDVQPRQNWIHYVGGLTAAACLALAFVRYHSGTEPAPGTTAQAEPKPAVQVAVAPVAENPTPSLISLRRDPALAPDYSVLLTALREDEQRSFNSPEIQSSRLPSLFDDEVFAARPALGQRTFRSKQTPAPQAEFTAFQFQR